QPLRSHHGGEVDRAGRISTGASEAGDETIFHRIATARKYDRNGRSCRLGYDCWMQAACRNDDPHLAADEVGGQCAQSILLSLGPAVLKSDVATFNIARFTQALLKGPEERCEPGGCTAAEISHHR